jgi:hypothetical protein
MNLVFIAIEPISVHSRGIQGGELGQRLGPRFRGDERNYEAIQIYLISLALRL